MSQTDHLIASLVEVEDRYHRWWYQANSKPGSRPPQPVDVRPHRRRPRRRATSEDLRAIFGGAARYIPPEEVSDG